MRGRRRGVESWVGWLLKSANLLFSTLRNQTISGRLDSHILELAKRWTSGKLESGDILSQEVSI